MCRPNEEHHFFNSLGGSILALAWAHTNIVILLFARTKHPYVSGKLCGGEARATPRGRTLGTCGEKDHRYERRTQAEARMKPPKPSKNLIFFVLPYVNEEFVGVFFSHFYRFSLLLQQSKERGKQGQHWSLWLSRMAMGYAFCFSVFCVGEWRSFLIHNLGDFFYF